MGSFSSGHATLIVAYFGTLLLISKGVRVNISNEGVARLRTAEHGMVATADSLPLRHESSATTARGSYADACTVAGRRRFLSTCVTLGASRIDPALCASLSRAVGTGGSRSIGKRGHLVQLRRTVAEIGNADAYYRLRATLAAHAISPWQRSWMEGLGDDLPRGFEAIVEMDHENGATTFGTLLDYSEWFDPELDIAVSENELAFCQWLHEFRPECRDDFLMALPLYYLYQHSGEVMPRLRPTPDPWLDAMLKNTRGMLFWTSQWVELLGVISNIGQQGACRLIKDYMLSRPNASVVLEQIRYFATGQSFLQIIEDRSPTQLPVGSPDYLVGDWLHRKLGHSEPAG